MPKLSLRDFCSELTRQIELEPDSLIFIVCSNPQAENQPIKRIKIRPVILKGELQFQIASFTTTQCFTVNIKISELKGELSRALLQFRQHVARFSDREVHAEVREGHITYKSKQQKRAHLPDLAHNRPKRHLFQEGIASELLQLLGIMTPKGSVLRDKYDKFKQINRFLELVQDLLPEIGEPPHIVDFGCGKAYLTFALSEMLKEAKIIGLDARRDLVEKGNELAKKLHYSHLHFVEAKIADYQAKEPVDLVLALHACDTATDEALYKAIQMQAKAILVAPCCQHEVAGQIKKEALPVILKHGLLKERFAALITDALRAAILEGFGYVVDCCEFVDPEHTPKNLLIRAVKKREVPNPDFSAYREQAARFSLSLTLAKLLKLDR